jgi:hypothetical protein
MINVTDVVNKLIIDEALSSIEKKERDYSHFHPSEWEGCKRKIAYSFYESKGYIQVDSSNIKINPKLQRVFQNGHFMHDRWKDYLEKTNSLLGRWECKNWAVHLDQPRIFGLDSPIGCLKPKTCECGNSKFTYKEISVFDVETLWGGHVDAIVDLQLLHDFYDYKEEVLESERYLIVDFKSMNSFQFKKLEDPLTKHIIQMQIYMYITDIKNAKLIYENKDSQETKEFLVKFDYGLMEIEKARAISLKHLVTNASTTGEWKLPDRAYSDSDNYDCGYCKYKDDCWNEKHELKRQNKVVPLEVYQSKKYIKEIGELDV